MASSSSRWLGCACLRLAVLPQLRSSCPGCLPRALPSLRAWFLDSSTSPVSPQAARPGQGALSCRLVFALPPSPALPCAWRRLPAPVARTVLRASREGYVCPRPREQCSSCGGTPASPDADNAAAPIPREIRVRRQEKALVLAYEDGRTVCLPAELLRVTSLSSENRQRDNQGCLKVVSGRKHVGILRLELVGRYGVRIYFDDLHDSGIFSYDYLADLGRRKLTHAKEYLRELRLRGLSREPARRTRGGVKS